MLVDNSLLSRDLLENELQKYTHSAPSSSKFSERDRRLVSAYRSFVRFNMVKQKRELILDDFIFTTLAKYLCTSPKISYDEFRVIAGVAPPAAHKYFTAKCFLMFPRDENHCINSEDLVRFIERSIDTETATLNLMDAIAPGQDPLLTSLNEQQLESFLMKMIPEIDILQRMHESFHEFYVYTAAQKFLFFLDPRRSNLIPIKKIAHSAAMEELFGIRKLALQMANSTVSVQQAENELSKNWFSDANAVRLYSLFLELDKDQNGFLSMDEVAEFAGLKRTRRINFTRAAWERIFAECVAYSPAELDYKGFVRLVLALENPTTPASIRFFWNILDFDKSGRFTEMKIKYFYSEIYASLVGGYDVPSAAHVVMEVFDLLACNSSEGATLNDFLSSKQGHVVVSMLLDVNGFWRYDNRESLVGTEEEEDSGLAESGTQQQGGAADALDAFLGGGDGSSSGRAQGQQSASRSVVGSVLQEEDASPPRHVAKGGSASSGGSDGPAKARPVSADAKRRLLSQIDEDEEDGDKGKGGDDYDDSFDAYDDEIFSDEEVPRGGAVSVF